MRQLRGESDTHNKVFRKRFSTGDSEGFVSKMRRVEQLLDEAQAECERHHYNEASVILAPMFDDVPGPLAGRLFELLGRCATHGCAENWPELFRQAQASYEASNDEIGVARVLLYRGEAEAARGDLTQSSVALTQASTAFMHQEKMREAAHAAVVQARILLLQNRAELALEKADRAVKQFRTLQKPISEILARLLRSQVHTTLQNSPAASRDLLFSERIAQKADKTAHLRVALARAESLIWASYPNRAFTLLKPLAEAVSSRDEIATTAHYHRLCGLALKDAQPQASYARLSEACALFARLGQSYHLAECELGCGVALQRQGQRGDSHWAALERLHVARWPVLQRHFDQARHRGISTVSPFAQQGHKKAGQPASEIPAERRLQEKKPKRSYLNHLGRVLMNFINFLAGEPSSKEAFSSSIRKNSAPLSALRPLVSHESIARRPMKKARGHLTN